MAYSTQSDVQAAAGGSANLVALADLDGTFPGDAGASVATTTAAAIRTADGVINSYVGHRYAVPLATVPDTIRDLSASWAVRVLRKNRYSGAPLTDDQEQEKIDREWLEGVADGTISLGIEPTPEKASIVIDKAAPRDSSLETSRERLRGFI